MKFDSPLILDGGLATELERTFDKDLSGRLWSAHCLDQDPDAIRAVHGSYFEAGANVATTASYQASIQGFLDAGYSREEAVKLMRRSVQIAREARDAYGKGYVALSMGPYGAVLANGAEYTGDYGNEISMDDLVAFHRERLDICMQEPGVDFILFETIPSFLEARAIHKLIEEKVQELPPVAVSFSCRSNEHISDGTSLHTCLELLGKLDNIFAVGVNCTKPKYIAALLDVLLSNSNNNNKAILLYPDGGEEWDAIARNWNSSTKVSTVVFGKSMAGWAAQVTAKTGQNVILGGCCGVGPKHISCIREAIEIASITTAQLP
ncbi:homocysteine S-methyltransferase 2-like protein [Zychaea mexicana]|uniref:homocysteine S-methyltransferase 2-like protein n=1 Tax=Zychaea mexicana TaxID=64656 RepID=UPI0022FEE67A|nr:homocysteine S-methyltransferase 2-like protein [Zychaea mexicana]KAI9499057.1 homocysteine S-methyltransferase 2-like protein [Zychaea mexicana]